MRKAKKRKAARPRRRSTRSPASPRRAPAPRKRRSTSGSGGATELALAGLAHDIRTPLTGILALSELLLASEIPERERRWAAALKDAASHLAQLTTLVVDAARAGRAGLVMRAEPFALGDLIEAIGQSLTARAEGKGLSVTRTAAKSLPPRVSGDALRLRSALENLIDNAVKFTERGSVALKVSAARAPRDRVKLTFEVADTGIGIVGADLKRLFRPFAQANEGVARRYGGSGLGLAFAKGVAEAMGGDLTVTSRPGRGSTFRLSVVVDRAAPSPRAAAARRERLAGLRVLCVEDNPFGRVVLNTVLGELGHRVEFAGSGETALAAVERGRFDVVLMDVELTGMNGLETARRIRALPPPLGRIPIVGVSGHSAEGDAALAHEAGMNGYLHKPLSPRQLQEMLAEVIGAPAAED